MEISIIGTFPIRGGHPFGLGIVCTSSNYVCT